MSCERLRPELVDAALGAPASAELSRHLAECPRCGAELETRRGLLGRIDDAVVAGMEVAATPGFVARVRQRASQRHVAPWRATGWLLAVAATAVAAVGLFVRTRRPAPLPAPPVPAPPASLADQPRPPAQATPVPEEAAPLARTRRLPSTRAASSRPSEPEVLLRPGEAAFVRRFAEAARHQPVRAAALLQAGFDPGNEEPAPLRATAITPLFEPRRAIPRLDQQRGAISPLPLSREEIGPLSIPPARPRYGPGDERPSERQ